MTLLLQQILNGLSIGAIYAFIAVGYSLIYSILLFSNFAHSSFLLFGAYVGFFMVAEIGVGFPLSVIIAMIAAGAMAWLVEKVAYRPIRERNSPTLYFIIASMGVSIFFENLVIVTIGPRFRSYPALFKKSSISLGNVSVSSLDLLIAVLGVILVICLDFFIEHTKFGTAVRAASWDLEAVGLMGINTNLLIGIVFFIAGSLAGLAGTFLGTKYTVYPQLGGLTLKAYVGAIFGGLSSVKGAVVGSLLLGVLETLIAGFVSSQLRDLFVFLMLILILLVRPQGLVGRQIEDRA